MSLKKQVKKKKKRVEKSKISMSNSSLCMRGQKEIFQEM